MPTHIQPGVDGERVGEVQTTTQPGTTQPGTSEPGTSEPGTSGAAPPPWLQRTSLVLLVATCCYIGILLIVLPWTPLWQENHFLGWLPERWVDWLMTGAARGIVSGLGLLDLWIGLEEAIGPRRRKKVAASHTDGVGNG